MRYGYNGRQGGIDMRSVVLDEEKANLCGICGAKEPFIEYKEIEGVHFIWCNKCNTITFFKQPQSLENKQLIENEMNFYKPTDKK